MCEYLIKFFMFHNYVKNHTPIEIRNLITIFQQYATHNTQQFLTTFSVLNQ